MLSFPDSPPPATAEMSESLDLLVIGLGPAGVSAAIQAHRDGLRLLAVSDEPVGGLTRAARRIRNLPGLPEIGGQELAERMAAQLLALGVPQAAGRVDVLSRAGSGFLAELNNGMKLFARAICLATGTRARTWDALPAPGTGRRVHRDVRSLPADLAGQQVVVVGGGEAALDTALGVIDRRGKPVLLVRGRFLRSAPGLIQEARAARIDIRLEVAIEQLRESNGSLALVCSSGGELMADHLVVCIGREPRHEFLDEHLPGPRPAELAHPLTPGVFWAGDVIRGRDRYVAAALGDGQRAAILAGHYLEERRT